MSPRPRRPSRRCSSASGLVLCLLAGAPSSADAAVSAHAAEAADHPAAALAGRALDPTWTLGSHGSPAALHARLVQPWAGGTVVRLQQRIGGLLLVDQEIIVSLTPSGAVRSVRGARQHEQPLPPSRITSRAAIDAARGALVPLFARAPVGRGAAEDGLFLDRRDQLHRVFVVRSSFAEPPSSFRVVVDAGTGAVLQTRRTSAEAQANVYPSNPANSEPEEVELLGLTSATQLDGEYATVQSCATWEESGGDSIFSGGTCTAVERQAVPDADGDYLYTIAAGSLDDPMAEVQMYHHLDKVARWFDDELGFAHPSALQGIVNFTYRNAFFGDADDDGVGEVAFGQTSQVDFAYDGDVVAHEYVHSVIDRVAAVGFIGADEYGLEWAAGSLNEGSADLFSVALYGDPALGEYAGPGFAAGASVRDVDADRRCPDDLYGESHRDGLIWGSLGWNMISDPVLGALPTATVVFGAALLWPSDVNWPTAGETLLESADALLDSGAFTAAQRDAVVAHATQSGIIECERAIPLDGGAQPVLLLVNGGLTGDFGRVPAGAQLRLDAPEGTRRLRFRVREFLANSTEVGWAIYVRRGGPVLHEISSIFGFDFPVPTTFDFVVDGEDDGFDLVLDDASEPALEPGATYYFSIASTNLGGMTPLQFANAEITLAGDVVIDAADDDDSGDDDDAGSGCADCGATLSPAAPSPLLALPLLLRRRRRR